MTVKETRRRINSILASTQGLAPMDQATMNDQYYEAATKAAELVDAPQLKSELLIDIVQGQQDYLMPLDLHQFVDVQYLNTETGFYEPLKNVELSTLRKDRSDVIVYAHAGVYRTAGADYGKRILRLSLAPEADITSGLLVNYKLKPTRLEDLADTDSIIDFPDAIQAIIPFQAAFLWMGWQGSKSNKDSATAYNQYFEAECRRVNALLGDQHQKDVRREISTDWGGMVL
jgi:hypothetical protein